MTAFLLAADPAEPIPRDVWAVATCSRCRHQRRWIVRDDPSPDARLRSTGWQLDSEWREALCPRCQQRQGRLL